MPICQTKFHGTLTFEPEQVLQVPQGLFGFAGETEFLLIELPSSRPVVFVQSVKTGALCFTALPVQVIESGYALELEPEALANLGYSGPAPPRMGKELLCLALLTMGNRRATANLMAPLVIDIAAHRGQQVVMPGYSHQHELSDMAVQ